MKRNFIFKVIKFTFKAPFLICYIVNYSPISLKITHFIWNFIIYLLNSLLKSYKIILFLLKCFNWKLWTEMSRFPMFLMFNLPIYRLFYLLLLLNLTYSLLELMCQDFTLFWILNMLYLMFISIIIILSSIKLMFIGLLYYNF